MKNQASLTLSEIETMIREYQTALSFTQWLIDNNLLPDDTDKHSLAISFACPLKTNKAFLTALIHTTEA